MSRELDKGMPQKNNDNLLDWAKKKQDIVGKLTPIELKNKEFSKKLKGYDVNEVNEFITEVYENYKDLFRENALLNEKVSRLVEELTRYKEMEEKMNSAIMNAQTMGEDLRLRAQKEAEDKIAAAEKNAKEILDKATEGSKQTTEEAAAMKAKLLSEMEEMKSTYLSEVNRLKTYRDELLKELKHFFQKKAGELQKIVNEIKSEIKDQSHTESPQKDDQNRQ
ncbi:DivIVA domain-containing protein [bacterium]|nr:DivIVA domain-containing protein [bacterium]